MKPSSYRPLTPMVVLTCLDATTVQTTTLPNNCSAFMVTVETNDVAITVDGTSPAAGTGRHVYPKSQPPQLVLLGPGTVVKAVSTVAGTSVVNITPLA